MASNRPKRLSRSGIFAGVVLCALLGGIVVYEWRERGVKPASPPGPPLVRVAEMTEAARFDTKSYPGVATEAQVAKLSFRVPGQLLESHRIIGARIAKGDPVARLDPRDYKLAVQRLEAELQSARSLYTAMTTGARAEDVATLEAQLEAAKSADATAEANLKRFTALLADQVASQAQYDLAKTQFDAAKGQKETLENELEKATTGARKEEIDAAAARIEGIQASLNTARNALADTVIHAPFEGFIVEKFVEDHEFVGPGLPVVSFATAARLDVAAGLPEEIIVRLDDIQAYRVEFESYPGRVYPATLKEIGRAVQRGRQSYPLRVRIDLSHENPETAFFPGMTAMVHIDLTRHTVPRTVPLAALFGEGDATAVWVLEKNAADAHDRPHKIVRRPVKLIRIVGALAEIESDLAPGEQIVAAGARSLREGQEVRVGKMENEK